MGRLIANQLITNGISFASDFNGNVLATMDFDPAETGIMYADVPTKGVRLLQENKYPKCVMRIKNPYAIRAEESQTKA